MNRYYYLLRPPGISCQPDGAEAYGAYPRSHSIQPIPQEHQPDGREVKAHGWVDYPQPLDIGQMWKYDLYPADLVGQARWVLYADADGDLAKANETLEYYAGWGEIKIAQARQYKSQRALKLLAAVKVLKDAGESVK